eukprot:TRINITY_DN10355_c0_g1_i1.p1 TRINITY_DN10355_c0_g1~~TRINITY_DN10355_c0_g1_i1.p1  ORF type:complete len:296 (+),score=110.70 TRINITY_DN10355_c0_g1_i1:76-888(+)
MAATPPCNGDRKRRRQPSPQRESEPAAVRQKTCALAGLREVGGMDGHRAALAAGPVVVVYSAAWEAARSEAAAAAAVAAARIADVAVVRAESCEDEGGELFYEAAIGAVPAVRLYSSGRQVFSAEGRSAAGDVEVGLKAALQQLKAPQPMEEDGRPGAVDVGSATQFAAVKNAPELTIFDFYADWCKPCMRIMPEIPRMAADYPDVKFFKVDRDRLKDLHDSCGVLKIPTFQVYRGGCRIDELQSSDHQLVRAMLDKHCGSGGLTFDDDF